MASVFKGMRFCRECDNMLQPVEERLDTGESSRLVYKCRICGHRDPAIPGSEQDHCVYRSSDPASGAAEGGGQGDFFFAVDKECVKDPTLSREKNVTCKKCQHKEAVTFTNPTKDRINLIYVCTQCTYYWRKEKDDDVSALQM
jgi:DNA-directed RNA polymerase subunit M/transcription elongation factor TFIIS